MNYDTYTIESIGYKSEFWHTLMRGKRAATSHLEGGSIGNNMFVLPL